MHFVFVFVFGFCFSVYCLLHCHSFFSTFSFWESFFFDGACCQLITWWSYGLVKNFTFIWIVMMIQYCRSSLQSCWCVSTFNLIFLVENWSKILKVLIFGYPVAIFSLFSCFYSALLKLHYFLSSKMFRIVNPLLGLEILLSLISSSCKCHADPQSCLPNPYPDVIHL